MSRQPTAVGTLVTTALLFFSSLDDDSVCRELGDGVLSRVARAFCQHESSKNSLSGLGADPGAGVIFRKGLAEKTTSGHRVGGDTGYPNGALWSLEF